MRRAVRVGQKQRRLGQLELDQGFLNRYSEIVIELMGSEYGQLHEQRDTIDKWLSSEEENFGRTLEQGSRLLDDLIRAKEKEPLRGGAPSVRG